MNNQLFEKRIKIEQKKEKAKCKNEIGKSETQRKKQYK